MRRLTVALALALLSSPGVLDLSYPSSGSYMEAWDVEVAFGDANGQATIAGNGTNASVTVSATLLETTTDALYLNNTNATGTYHARLELVETSGVGNLDLLRVGIDNGTQTDQIEINLGNLTQTTGPLVQLAPGSTNTIYVTESVSLLSLTSDLVVDVYAASDPNENAYQVTRFNLTIT